jgi:hypothetical protein
MGLVLTLTVLVGGVCLVVVAVVALRRPSAAVLFRRYVANPIPASVTDVKVDGYNAWSYQYVFKFKISPTDVDAIIASRPFQRVRNVSYASGSIDFEWSPTCLDSAALYPPPARKPSWFVLESWEVAKAYAWHETKVDAHTQLLVYNKELGQAYFIVSSDN